MRTLTRKEKLTSQITMAFLTGMFSMIPAAFGMPAGGVVKAGDATIGEIIESPDDQIKKTLPISSNAQNNVIAWGGFSIGDKEKVQFDGGATSGDIAHNYMNIVTGDTSSQIDGHIKGGNDVYLINPNGVVFNEGSQVEVGNLYVSTRAVNVDAAVEAANKANNQESYPGSKMSSVLSGQLDANMMVADVVNLGSIKANNVTMEGANIRIQNTDDIQLTDPNGNITLAAPSSGYVHVGYEYDSAAAAEAKATVDNAASAAVEAAEAAAAAATAADSVATAAEAERDAAKTAAIAATAAVENATTEEEKAAAEAAAAAAVSEEAAKTEIATNARATADALAAQAEEKANAAAAAQEAVNSNETAEAINLAGKRKSASVLDYKDGGSLWGANASAAEVLDYRLVSNVAELNAMSLEASDNYMLNNDIDFSSEENSGATFIPVTNFKGNFDGMFHTIKNMKVSTNGNAGLFAEATGATLENVGFENAEVSATVDNKGAGALVGYASNVAIRNVYSSKGKIKGEFHGGTGVNAGGGIVGIANKATVSSVYVSGGEITGGDIIGAVEGDSSHKTSIKNVYSNGVDAKGTAKGLVAGAYAGVLSIENSYTNQESIFSEPSIVTNSMAKAQLTKNKDTYSNWDITNTGGIIKTKDEEGNITSMSRPVWRIYEGQTLPLLTAFFKGTIAANYTYRLTDTERDQGDLSKLTLKDTYTTGTNDGKDVTRIYDRKSYSVDPDSFSSSSFSHELAEDENGNVLHVDYEKNTDINSPKRVNVADSGDAVIWSDQQGYDILGTNVTITKRPVTLNTSGLASPVREYNGVAVSDTDLTTASLIAVDTDPDKGFIDGDQEAFAVSGKLTRSFYTDNQLDANVGNKLVKIKK